MILPAFFIILLIAAIVRGLMKYAGVKAFLTGVRPCVVGLILSAGITMGAKTLFSYAAWNDLPNPDLFGLFLFALLWIIRYFW